MNTIQFKHGRIEGASPIYTRMKSMRTEKRLKQSEVARIIGVSTTTYCAIENGVYAMRPNTKERVEKFYRNGVEYLLEAAPETERHGRRIC